MCVQIRFHRLSTSLPDLDPDSPALSVSMDSSDMCMNRKSRNMNDSDLESNFSFSFGAGIKVEDEEATSSTIVSCPPKTRQSRVTEGSIVDLLAKKVCSSSNKREVGKASKRKKYSEKESKILKSSNEPELLSTPSLTIVTETSDNRRKGGKSQSRGEKPKPITVPDSYLLQFRKESVSNFRDAFRNKDMPNEFSTLVLKSRTRTETRVLKKQATIREVFGEDRPASAPPMQTHGDTSQEDDEDEDSQNDSQGNDDKEPKSLRQKFVARLRSAGIIRSQKAIINSKKQLILAKRRNHIKTMAVKKIIKKIIKKEAQDEGARDADNDATLENNDEGEEGAPSKKRLKLRTGRRKFRSGFDYIRKKKKPLKKDDILPKERKRVSFG